MQIVNILCFTRNSTGGTTSKASCKGSLLLFVYISSNYHLVTLRNIHSKHPKSTLYPKNTLNILDL